MRNAASRRDAVPRIEGIGEGGQTPCLKLAAAHWMWPTAPRRQRFGPGRYPATDTTVQIPLSAAEHIYHGVLRYGLRAHTEFTGAPVATASRCGLRRYPGGRVAPRAGR